MNKESTIVWRNCQTDPPDTDRLVLLFAPAGDPEPVWPGWKEGSGWYWSDAFNALPTLWAEIPIPDEAKPKV